MLEKKLFFQNLSKNWEFIKITTNFGNVICKIKTVSWNHLNDIVLKQKSKTNHRFDLWFDIRSSRELNTTTYESQQRGEWSALELVSKSVGTCRVMRMRESFIYLSFFDRFIVRLGEKLFSRQEWQTCNEAWLWIGLVQLILFCP